MNSICGHCVDAIALLVLLRLDKKTKKTAITRKLKPKAKRSLPK